MMDNHEAIKLIRNLPTMCEFTDAYGESIDSDDYYEAVDIAISALQEQDSRIRIICKTCKHDPPSKKWPCVDCDMREPTDGWEPKEAKNSTESTDATHGRIFQEIVVKYPSISTYIEYEWKPYFSIKYTENGQEFIGYGTYKPEVLSEYLKEFFIPSAQPEIVRCKDCKYITEHYDTDGNAPYWTCSEWDSGTDYDGFCHYAERRTDE